MRDCYKAIPFHNNIWLTDRNTTHKTATHPITVVGVINGVATVVYKKKYVAAGLVPVEGGTEAAQAQ